MLKLYEKKQHTQICKSRCIIFVKRIAESYLAIIPVILLNVYNNKINLLINLLNHLLLGIYYNIRHYSRQYPQDL